jgi:hypothetical protein
VDAGTRDRFLTGVTGRLRQVLPRIRQATVFSESAEVLYDSTGFAGPIEIENFHRTREAPSVVAHDDVAARCAYDDEGHCLALFSHPGPAGRGTWHVLLRVQEPRGATRVGEATVRKLAPFLHRLFEPLARLPHHDPSLERRLAAVARERVSERRIAQLLLTAVEVFGASAAYVSAPALGAQASMHGRSAPRSWRGDAPRAWIDALSPTRLKAAGAVRPRVADGVPDHCTGVLCVPLTGLPGRTVGRLVLAFSADDPPSVPLPPLLRIAALVVAALAEERDRTTGVWKQKAFLAHAARLRREAPHAPLVVLHVKADWTDWPAALEPRLKALQDAAAFLRTTLPARAVLGLARGGAFVALASAARPDDGAALATSLERSARGRPSAAPALPALAIRFVVAEAGEFRTAMAALATAPVACTTAPPARIPVPVAAPKAPAAFAPAAAHGPVTNTLPPRATRGAAPESARAVDGRTATASTVARATARTRGGESPLAFDPERLELLWTGRDAAPPALLVRPPSSRDAVPVDTSATGVFVDAPAGVDLRYLDLVFRDAAELARPAALLLSVAAVSVSDRQFRSALRRLAAPLASRDHALHLLVSARYADEQPARLAALRDEGWRVGLHLFAGGRLQVRTLANARGDFVYLAPDLVQDCLRSELSRLQVRSLLAQTKRAGFVPCAHLPDVPRLASALAMDGRDEARRAG